MVGVPYSKGCLLCRERRIACDQTLPQCMQCCRYGVGCPGYKRPWQFKDEGPRLQKRYQKKCSNARTHSEAINSNGIFTKFSIDERVHPALVHQSFISQQPQVFKEFICAAFPTMFFHNEFRFGNGFNFADCVVKHFGSKQYHDASVSCLSAEYLGHLTGDPRLHQFGRQEYSKALGAIRRALNSDEALSDSLLLAVILLSIYEMNTRTTRDAWVYHSRAVKQLLLRRRTTFCLSGVGRVCHFAYRPFLIAAALYEGEPCFLADDNWQDLAAFLRMEDSQKQSEWAFYINVYETIFMELVKCPGYIKEAREIVSVTSPKARLLAQRICIAGDRLRTLSDELRSLLASHNQRKEGIIFRSFVGPQPNAFPETSPSLLLRAAVTATSILEELFIRLTTPAYAKGESPSSSRGAPQSVGVSGAGGPLLDFRFTFELGGRTGKDNPCHFTWLDRVAGSMGLLGAEITYVE
ncbi:hypothetical protein N7489_003878 [Penicillium chrysogenum]|uniref:uncharacterized protein n=1 Tax=Penicillium chrysogenum TaxID=5076 RepID=UPI00238F853F|nr:uncharacterized protein N7489_003878 [Penicillium chrysogenum]KAJ5243782.1 hypothetical protein N7489_003878 [Penicillium chrysogenum]KAJ5286078.1 hypothetical protein N7524_001384 [Penicillium chrysogenum]KAJ6140859.1 hypothetical protein N7497_011752 [Penicillium chrysogenum]